MLYTQEHTTITLEIKQSKFISHCIPYTLYTETLKQLKIQHPKARHFVVAYRYLNSLHQIVEHSSDDGEPKGTSGKPSLMVLQGENLINTAVITVRYFGGTKLGTGGLVRAYSEAVHRVLESSSLVEYKELIRKNILFTYADVRQIEYECDRRNIRIVDKDFSDTAKFTLESDKTSMEEFLEKLQRSIQVL